MINPGEHYYRSWQHTLPPLSNKTLHHPSLQTLYMASSSAQSHTHFYKHTDPPIITPAEMFYTDSTLSCGSRIPNFVRQMRVFSCLQLNTPPPCMTPCQARPPHPDPFRSSPLPTIDLGSLSLKMNQLHPPVQLILELSQEEDQTITNLLQLHHQEAEATLVHTGPDQLLPSAEAGWERCWSEKELEAASTLLGGFGVMEEDKMWSKSLKNDTATPPNALPDLTQGSFSSEVSPCCQEKVRVCDVQDDEQPGRGDFLKVKRQTLSESDRDTAHVLLSLGRRGSSVQ